MLLKFNFKLALTVLAGTLVFCIAFGVISYPSVLAKDDPNTSFAILMYHHISKDATKVGDYVITPAQFEQDLKYLKDNGYRSITLRQLYAIDNGERDLQDKSVMITFDDGQESFYIYAYPLLKKYGFTAVFSVIGRYTDEYSQYKTRDLEYSHITWSQMRELAKSGVVEFGNHSYDYHHNDGTGRDGVTKMKNESYNDYKTALQRDVAEFNSTFEKNMNFIPTLYTYPFGRFSKETAEIIKGSGFTAAFTCYEKRVVPKNSADWLYNLGRFNRSGNKNTESFFKSISVI